MKLPKKNIAKRIGKKGVNVFTSIVEDELNWQVRIIHQEDDYGIDAYIDIITEEGYLTGKSIAVQIKSGTSYFRHKTEYGWEYFGEFRHLNYYLNHEIPVILVIVDTDKRKAYWEICDAGQTEKRNNGWSIVIPFHQGLNKDSKQELIKYVSPTIDYVSQLEEQWARLEAIKEFKGMAIIIDKTAILNCDYKPLVETISHITSNTKVMFNFRAKIDIAIDGFNQDARQLYDIDEVKTWVVNVLGNVSGLSFFLVNNRHAQFLKLFLYSQVKIDVVDGSEYTENGLLKRVVAYDTEEAVKVLHKLFYDLNAFGDHFKIPEPIMKECSENIISCLLGEK